jgi:hypothetical protein
VVAVVFRHTLASLAARKLELSEQKKITGVLLGKLDSSSFKSGISLSTLSLDSFQPPVASLYVSTHREEVAYDRSLALEPPIIRAVSTTPDLRHRRCPTSPDEEDLGAAGLLLLLSWPCVSDLL